MVFRDLDLDDVLGPWADFGLSVKLARMNGPVFAMLACAHGAEVVVKRQIAAQGWSLAFSRPGFVTCKHDGDAPLPSGPFVRLAAESLGSARDPDADIMIEKLIAVIGGLPAAGVPSIDQLHVWPRDRAPIGRFDFEPGPDEVSRAIADRVFTRLAAAPLPEGLWRASGPNQIGQPGQRVLDVALVEPAQWFFGVHQCSRRPSTWPGGVQPIQTAQAPTSRAYYKAAEAIEWSGIDLRPGDRVVEIGSAPGGACQRLLEMGCRVTGIDPAEMDPIITEHPRMEHIRARADDLPRRAFGGQKWLLMDANIKPDATLGAIERIVRSHETSFAGALLTLKLGTYETAENIPAWIARIESWGPSRVEIRQLARNRCEVCVAVIW